MSKSSTVRLRALAGVALAGPAAFAAIPALAQETDASGGLEEIVVTAQHREERMQDVPIAVAAVTANALRDNGVDTTRDLPQIVPSVQFTRSGASGLLFVRGVGTTNAAVGEEGANAVYIDGVYMADLGQTINNFNNIERIEVLKGPQGTLFGRNATGGLIHIITREPGDEWKLDGQLGYGNYDTINARAYVGGPITDKVGVDLALTKTHQSDGWGHNVTLDRKNKVQDFAGARSKLVIRPTDAVKLIIAGDYYENHDNLALGYQIDPGTIGSGGQIGGRTPTGQSLGWWDATLNDYPDTRQKIWGVSGTLEADLGFAKLTSISAYRKTTNRSSFDVDGGPLSLLKIDFVSGGKSIQQEVRLASTMPGPLSWQLGVFYLHNEATNDSNFSGLGFAPLLGQHIVADLKSDSYAAFAEATYAITPTTHLTGGIRYTKDKRDFDGGQANVTAAGEGALTKNPMTKLSYNKVTWRAALRQDITPDINVYLSANRGFKAGSYSLQSPLNSPYLPQTITAYEAGLKSELFDRKLRLNLSAYHYDIQDYQVRSAATAALGASVTLNAATVKVDGIDIDFEAAPTQHLRLFGGATILDSRYGKFGGAGATFQAPIIYPRVVGQTQATTCPANLAGTKNPGVFFPNGVAAGGYFTCFGDVSGLRTMNAPKFTASFGASYKIPVGETGQVRLSGLYSYNSGFVFEPDTIARQPRYSLVNGSIEYRPAEQFGFELWIRNAFNEKYSVQKISSGTGITQSAGAPRTYGVNLNFSF
ncbi:TonB-dependent receptor [Novosphingobium album (ex Liu et al. 2023)]|uniref:TonB-dependent receptor n=1 Tax=Novosphingobium album (ex Liu et al. 2023) TaxID=3031130 RepID=A0ABT5WLR9_9SPHN|nr:TonB-dependent receptor [Novosphingobium album (ex Liu et al. 2023)]MDE8650993.1 TonB-dependent receptor [Novosphingobium album (ex Liu et al. 2023)]